MHQQLWQAIQLESAPLDAALLIEIFVSADQLLAAPGAHDVPVVIETSVGRFRSTAECGFYDLVLAVWLIARRARIARHADRRADTDAAVAQGARMLLLANARRGPAPGDGQALKDRPSTHRAGPRSRSEAR